MQYNFIVFFLLQFCFSGFTQQTWQSKFVKTDENHNMVYIPDERGNVIPDFSKVGFASGEKEIPFVQVAATIEPVAGDNLEIIQQAINRIAERTPDQNGFRGTLLLKKGTYNVNGTIFIRQSGIVIRGEGANTDGSVIIETATKQCDLFRFEGKGRMQPDDKSKVRIREDFVPVGRKYLELENAGSFKAGDSVLIYRPGTQDWIHDLKMDQIVVRE